MKLYDAGWAPSPRRVRMFLTEKGVDLAAAGIERVTVDLGAGGQFDPDFLRINPRGTVPVLVLDNGLAIADSVAICRYFEALHPEPCLFGATPIDQAATEEWTRIVEHEGYAAVVYAFRNRSRAMVGRALAGRWPEMPQIPELVARGQAMWGCFIDRLEARLADRMWLATDAFGFADLSAFVTLDFAVATRLSDGAFPPAIARWHAAIAARESAGA
ncbi:glutathione S-transferase [Sphingomonas changnyeongensis]|uniref:Glutathione S-transferase n=2 Tax=Sphingomonas changnyeongensis TaxID=2698679 RepID=A0A7Z2S657_9SPHN|nr:glutathione S-transferase [Sphingomonas changnyeongensis]